MIDKIIFQENLKTNHALIYILFLVLRHHKIYMDLCLNQTIVFNFYSLI